MSPKYAKWLRGLALGLSAAALALALWGLGVLTPWERATYDMRAAFWAQPGPHTGKVKIIALDQTSLDWAAENSGLGWPWPRQAYAYVIDYLSKAGAKAVIFDVLYSEPSNLAGDDEQLASAASRSGRFVGALMLGKQGGRDALPEPIAAKIPAMPGAEVWLQTHPAPAGEEALTPIAELAQGAWALGNVSSRPDADQVVRSISMVRSFNDRVVPNLGLAAWLRANPGQAALDADRLETNVQAIQLDDQGRALLNYRGPAGTFQSFSAAAVIQSALQLEQGAEPTIADAAIFKDCYVFFGFTAPGLHDLRAAPVSPLMPGVEIQATALDNLLSGDFLRQAPDWSVVVATLAFSLVCAFIGLGAATVGRTVMGLCLLLPLPGLGAFLAYPAGWWWPFLVVETGAALALLGAVIINFAVEGRQRRFIKKAFRHYLSPVVIERILEDPDKLKLGGERRELSIFFSDLAGFTSLSEGLEPEELTLLLNDYLSEASDFILETGGTLDKFEGDAIIAFWNAPLDQPDHALAACRAALLCQQRLSQRADEYNKRVGRPLTARIGINTGPVVVGNMGSRQRFDYTVLGDAANLASRLEGANKVFGTPIMVSESTWQQTGGKIQGRLLGRLRVVGRSEPVAVYEPMSLDHGADQALIDAFEQGVKLVEAGELEQARQMFTGLEGDPAAQSYLNKLGQLEPGETWDGIWNLTSK